MAASSKLVSAGRGLALAVIAFAGSGVLALVQAQDGFVPFAERAYRLVNSVAFAPADDTMYFALLYREVLEHRGEPDPTVPEVALFRAQRRGDGWSEPELMPFAGRYKDYEPTLTADGSFMVFNSTRPWPDGRTPEVNDLWMVEQEAAGEWGEPARIEAITTFENEESYATLMADRTLIFGAGRPGPDGEARFDLYESRYADGYQTPVRHPVSTDRWGEGDPWVAPDGSYLIFTRWDDAVGWYDSVDLYITFRETDGWTDPVAMDSLNTEGPDYGAAVSPDGRWLYYRASSRFQRRELAPVLDEYQARAGS